MNKYVYTTILSSILLAGCSSNGPLFHSWGEYENERTENGIYRVEEPYEIKGVWYAPAEQPTYSEKGLASWYMPSGDSALTANGEIYDVNIPSARHKTLPLPSIVKITNLENEKSIVARVNDRGPMVNNRLIDVSQAAAKELGMPSSGTVLVQVDLLPEESLALKQHLLDEGRVYQTALPTEEVKQDGNPFQIVAPQKTAVATPVKSAKTQTKTKAPVASGSYVQLGSFSDAQNATRLKSKLEHLYPVYVEQVQKNGRALSLVKVGPYANKSEATQILSKLKQQGYRDAYLTR